MTLPINPLHHRSSASRPRWPVAVLIVVVIIIGWYVALGVGVYSGRWHGAKTERLLRWTPLPVATVGWQPLSYATYLDQRQAVDHYTKYVQTSSAGVYQAQSAADTSATALTKMIRLKASEKLLKKLKVAVSVADINQAYTSQLVQNGNADQVKATIRQLYGWSPEQFKQQVIRPAIIRDKLQEKLSFDASISAAAKTQAEKVLGLVKAGQETFTDLAKKYSDDVYGANGGDLGFVKQGEQTKEIDDLAFTLELNQVSDIIHTKYGYHIIKPTERKTVNGVEQVHLLQITILAPQVDDYLNTELKKTSVSVFVHGLGWDKQNSRVKKK